MTTRPTDEDIRAMAIQLETLTPTVTCPTCDGVGFIPAARRTTARRRGEMRVLVGCEESGVVRSAFTDKGHEVLSADLQPTRKSGPHYQGDVFDVIDFPWDLGLFYFPCTDSSVSGARHFSSKKFDGRFYASASLWIRGWRRSSHIPRRCFEHPVSVISSLFRKPDQIIQPWMFGHFETKQTCLWLDGLPKLTPIYQTPSECAEALGLPTNSKPIERIHRMPPKKTRARDRSETFVGIAHAKADQWG